MSEHEYLEGVTGLRNGGWRRTDVDVQMVAAIDQALCGTVSSGPTGSSAVVVLSPDMFNTFIVDDIEDPEKVLLIGEGTHFAEPIEVRADPLLTGTDARLFVQAGGEYVVKLVRLLPTESGPLIHFLDMTEAEEDPVVAWHVAYTPAD